MSLLGNGAMVFWHDVAPGTDADYRDWHAHEHISERVGIPGFLRGRRCASVDGGQQYFIMYEVDDLAVLTSPAYLARLNDPSEWTARALGHFRNSNRTLCRRDLSFGVGVGRRVASLQFSPQPDRAEDLRAWLAVECLPALAGTSGLCGAHLLVGDETASRTETEEKALRDRPDEVADWVLLLEAYEDDALAGALAGPLAVPMLHTRGADIGGDWSVYGLRHCASKEDVAAAR
jgi:hypothetical protein